MKTLQNHASRPASQPLLADDVLEFHAGRIVLLLSACGGSTSTINGLTKMAKLDFFVRYPDFFVVASGRDSAAQGHAAVEAAMVRHHYGPWDKRYYHVLAFLESRDLITVKQSKKSFRISLTKQGRVASNILSASPAFTELREHMNQVADAFSRCTGNELKSLIYKTFGEDVSDRPLGHVIGSTDQ